MYHIECTDEVISYDRHCLYVTCRYLHDCMDSYPEANAVRLKFKSVTVEQVGQLCNNYFGAFFSSCLSSHLC